MEVELKISMKYVYDMPFERVHHVGRSSAGSDQKPRPIIAKFTFHKDKEFVLSHARNLNSKTFALARYFPRDHRKAETPCSHTEKNGDDARLICDKLYIIGQLHKP